MNFQVLALVLMSVSMSLAAELQFAGDFDAQARSLLAERLLRPEQVAALGRVYRDLRHTLRQAWPGVRILPIGSLVTGLALQNSDVDVVVKVNDGNAPADRLVQHSLELFRRDADTYRGVRGGATHGGRRLPLIHLTHAPTDRECDISFSSQASVESSKLLSYYLTLDHRIKPLISLLKLWIETQMTDSREHFQSKILYALVIFYLEQKHIVPPPIVLQEDLTDRFENKWDARFNMIPFKSNNTESLYQLLGGFFKYYSTLNFADNFLAVHDGKVYPRNIFLNTSTIPEAFAVYKDYLTRPNSIPLELDCDICVQDFFLQHNNVADSISSDLASDFFSHLKFAAKAFEELPSDRFLPAILTKIDLRNSTLSR